MNLDKARVFALVALLAAGSAQGATLVVDDDGVQCPAAGFSTITSALAAASNGDTIQVCDGTYIEGTIMVTKEVVIDGVNRDAALIHVNASSNYGFWVSADNVTISDLSILEIGGAAVNDANGIRYQSVTSLESEVVRNVVIADFYGGSARGIEISDTTMNDLTVTDSTFRDNRYGIRMNTNSHVDGFILTNSTFVQNTYGTGFERIGVYQVNDGNVSTLRDFQASGNTFTNHDAAGMYLGEIEASTISGNDFTGNNYDIYIIKYTPTSGATINNLLISDNDFLNHKGAAIYLRSSSVGLGPGVVIADNRVSQDVSVVTSSPRGAFITNLLTTDVHSLLTISGNSFVYAGAFPLISPSRFAIQLGGDGPVNITGNSFDGSNLVSTGTPPFAAIYVHTNHATMGVRSDPLLISCNAILDFVHGITFYDTSSGSPVPGNLAPGTVVDIHANNIVGNSEFGVFNGTTPGSSQTVDANGNWWGSPSGPSGAGPGTGDAISANVDATTFQATALSGCVALSITKIDTPDPVAPGMQLTYTITVTNDGGQAATGVVVTDTIDPTLTAVTTTGCVESPAGGSASCTIGVLGAGASAVVTITGTVGANTPAVINNTATVSAVGVTPDANDSASAVTTVTVAADLDIVKTLVPNGEITTGSIVTFNLEVTNSGPSNATLVSVTDDLPDSLQFVASGCATEAGSIVSWSIGNLAVGSTVNCQFTARVLASGAISNTASVSGAQADPDPTDSSTATFVALGAIEVPMNDPLAMALMAIVLAIVGSAVLSRFGH